MSPRETYTVPQVHVQGVMVGRYGRVGIESAKWCALSAVDTGSAASVPDLVTRNRELSLGQAFA